MLRLSLNINSQGGLLHTTSSSSCSTPSHARQSTHSFAHCLSERNRFRSNGNEYMVWKEPNVAPRISLLHLATLSLRKQALAQCNILIQKMNFENHATDKVGSCLDMPFYFLLIIIFEELIDYRIWTYKIFPMVGCKDEVVDLHLPMVAPLCWIVHLSHIFL